VGERAKLKTGRPTLAKTRTPSPSFFCYGRFCGWQSARGRALSYLPWLLLGVLGLVIVVVIAYFLLWILVNVILGLVGIIITEIESLPRPLSVGFSKKVPARQGTPPGQ